MARSKFISGRLYAVHRRLLHRSTIRITLENVSSLPVDFVRLTFDDSTIAPAQQALAEGDLSVYDTYETEYDLIHRPVFTWDSLSGKQTAAPGEKLVITVDCFGKAEWSVTSSLCLVDEQLTGPLVRTESSMYRIPTAIDPDQRWTNLQTLSILASYPTRCSSLCITCWNARISISFPTPQILLSLLLVAIKRLS